MSIKYIKGTDDEYEFVFNEWYESSYPFGSRAVRENFLEKLNAVREARSDAEWSKYIDTEYLYLSHEVENGNITFDVNEDGETDTLDLYGIYLYCVGNNMECGSFDAYDIEVTSDMIKMPDYLRDVIWKNCDKLLDVYNFLEYKYYDMDEISARYILTHSDLFISNTSLEYFDNSYGSYDINGKETVTEFVYNLYEWMETYLGLESGLYEDNHVTVDDFIFEVYSNHAVLKECKSNAEKVTIPSEINGVPVTIIGESAFMYCTSLKSVTVPSSVKEIGSAAFLCTGINKMYYSGTAEEWKKITIAQDNYNLDNIDIECQIAYPVLKLKSDEEAQYMQGDANCDGKINMADVVLVMQSISNPDRYGLNGSEVSHITSQGIINGDMDNNGITNNDALGIQKKLLFGE